MCDLLGLRRASLYEFRSGKKTPTVEDVLILCDKYGYDLAFVIRGRDKAPGCQGRATGMHHLRGKSTIERLLNIKEMIPACNHCNGIWIEEHSEEAEKLGLKLSRNHK